MALPDSNKTILACNIGGIAGGSKYIVNGILFKFSVDAIIDKNKKIYMYGNLNRRDDLAMKSASQELKSLCCFISAQASLKLHFPLMSVIDYKGFRMTAVSVLPIDNQTLKYGSDNGGITVKNDIPDLSDQISYIAEYWNLVCCLFYFYFYFIYLFIYLFIIIFFLFLFDLFLFYLRGLSHLKINKIK